MRRNIAIATAWFTCLAGAIGLVLAASTGGGLTDDSAGFPFSFAGLALAVATDATLAQSIRWRPWTPRSGRGACHCGSAG